MLDNVRVASPCSASWDDMIGSERVRHCAGCDRDVFNLSAMTRDEAEALIRERVGNLCGRYFQRADGTIITSDCMTGIAQRRRRSVMAAGIAALLASAGGLAFVLSRRSHDPAHTMAPCPPAPPTPHVIASAPPPTPAPTPKPAPVKTAPVPPIAPFEHMHKTMGKLERVEIKGELKLADPGDQQ